MTFDEWWKTTGPGGKRRIGHPAECREAWDAATAAERERAAKVAESWCDPQSEKVGCAVAWNEGLMCSAPAGIAAAIRAEPAAP